MAADEYSFGGVPRAVHAGAVTFSFANDGKEPHMLVLVRIGNGHSFTEALRERGRRGTAEDVGVIPPTEPGEDAAETITADLEPGRYGLLCPLETRDDELHYDLGQRVELVVD